MMQTPARSGSNAGSFAKAVAEELVTMQSFVTLLEQERGALGEGKADTLPGLAAEKTTLMEILSRCAEQRARLLGVAGVSGTAAGIRQLLGSDPDAQEIWSNLLDVARRAAELNAGNGFLVNQRLAHVDRAIDAISGPRTSLYSTSGITNYGSGASRRLAQG
ncbi:MAG: flagellar protein FlgN [Betaproteobacteria bacterium]|nr:flagellar protein FlgN [Betaproteobacteria bacterium]